MAMKAHWWLSCLGLWSASLLAWDDQTVVEYVMAHNPVLRAQRLVTSAYTPPAGVMARVKEYSSVYGRAGLGGTDYISGESDPFVLQAGIQISIPLTSTKERREHALKAVEEVQAIETLRGKILADIATLRKQEADLAASEQRREFLEQKSNWLQQRVNEGFSDIEDLWTLGKQLNEERATSNRLRALVTTQRYQLASQAGDDHNTLLAYLDGRRTALSLDD